MFLIFFKRNVINLAPMERIFEEQRGRPRGRFNRDRNVLESMVWIAYKHDMDPILLVDSLFEALKNEISHCGSLEIFCRKVNQDSAMFLITEGEKVVWQFPINLDALSSSDVKSRIKEIILPKKVDNLSKDLNISELRFGMKGINITAKITEIPATRAVITRWGSEAFVSSVKMVDKTGSIRLSLWNNQIKTVNIGDEIEIKNCDVSRFADTPQLRLGRKSTMSIINQPQQENRNITQP
jgi:replication factor A1